MKVNHIGIITRDLYNDVKLYQRMGYNILCQIIDNEQKNKIVIVEKDGSPDIELIEPVNEESTIINFENGYHHICFEADGNEDIVEVFNKMRVGKVFTPPILAPALGNHSVVFACLYNGSFIELLL